MFGIIYLVVASSSYKDTLRRYHYVLCGKYILLSRPCMYKFVRTYCASNTYFYLVRVHISLFVRGPLSPVCLYVNLRVPVCLYVNICGFGPRTRMHLFVRVSLFPESRGLTLSPSNIICPGAS